MTDLDLAQKFCDALLPLAAEVAERLPLRSIASGFLGAGVSMSLANAGPNATAEWLRAIADEVESLKDTRGLAGRA